MRTLFDLHVRFAIVLLWTAMTVLDVSIFHNIVLLSQVNVVRDQALPLRRSLPTVVVGCEGSLENLVAV